MKIKNLSSVKALFGTNLTFVIDRRMP